MSFTADGPVVSLEAAADLSAKQYYIVDCTAAKKVNVAGAGATCIGVLENEPESGEAASVRVSGIAKVVAGAAISVGDLVASDSAGKAATAVASDYTIGVALEAAGADGDIIAVALALGQGTDAAASISGTDIATVAEDNAVGGVPVIHVTAVAGGAAANEDITMTHKTRVIDCWAVHTGGAGETSDTIQLFNGANAITDAMSWAGADNIIVRAASIDDAYHEVAAAGTLRVTTTDNDTGGDVGAGKVYTLGIRVA